VACRDGVGHAPQVGADRLVPLFDFDGTLVDSDVALTAPWHLLGVDPDLVPLGLPLVEACDRAGVTVEAYLAHYDPSTALPFPGISELLDALGRWGLASNKERSSGRRELERLGWTPDVALFSDDFGGQEKQLGPLLEAMALGAREVVFIGDTRHDRACASTVGARFALAGWNPRARAAAAAGDLVLDRPADVLGLLAPAN
jgi:phosphoglycolate phosphatase-like HAD superfamily hydrolase